MLGDTLSNMDSLVEANPDGTGLRVGYGYESSFTPTNPYVHDQQGKAITTGRLTITKLILTLAKSSGFFSSVTARNTTRTNEYNGRIVGDDDNVVGREVITDMQQSVPVGFETKDYTIQLRARRWLPFDVTAIQWIGQFFNRPQRVG